MAALHKVRITAHNRTAEVYIDDIAVHEIANGYTVKIEQNAAGYAEVELRCRIYSNDFEFDGDNAIAKNRKGD